MTQGVEKQIRSLAAIKSKCHFVAVGREMFRADVVPRSDNAALEQRERRLNSVGMNVTVNVHTRTVIDRLMLAAHEVDFARSLIRAKFVSDENLNVFADVHSDIARQSASSHVLS